MAPTTHRCEFAECTAEWQTESIETFLELYKIHVRAAHDDGAETSPSAKAERARRPELSSDISDEDWDYFVARWKSYKKATKLTGDYIVIQLMECCSDSIRRDHHRTYSGLEDGRDEETVLGELKKIAVKKRNKAVNRVKLGDLKQERGEPIRRFAGRVRSLASVSEFKVKCKGANCGADVSYAEEVIADQVVRGTADVEIQKDVLSHVDADTWDLENLLKFIEGKESGMASQGLMSSTGASSSVAAVGGGQGQDGGQRGWRGRGRNGRGGHRSGGQQRSTEANRGPCGTCGDDPLEHSNGELSWNFNLTSKTP